MKVIPRAKKPDNNGGVTAGAGLTVGFGDPQHGTTSNASYSPILPGMRPASAKIAERVRMKIYKVFSAIWRAIKVFLIYETPKENAPPKKVGSVSDFSELDPARMSPEEAQNIRKEIEVKKQRAKDLKLIELFEGLYFDRIRYYPEWSKKNPDLVCSLLTNVIQKNDKEISIFLVGNEYVFRFEEKEMYSWDDSESTQHGVLEFFAGGQKVFSFGVTTRYFYSDEPTLPSRSFGDIYAFIEGDWIQVLKKLEEDIKLEQKERAEKNSNKELQKLKKDFGII